MSKKTPSKKPAGEEVSDAASAEAAAAFRSPRAERQRVWTKRAEDAASAAQQVQQLVQQHTSAADATKQSLDQLTATAALLWALEAEDLPAQYRDKSRPASQRVGSAASGRAGGSADRRTSSKQGQRAASNNTADGPHAAAGPGEAATAASTPAAVADTVESAVRQLPPAQRAKVSAALQALFYAQPTAATVLVMSPVSPPGQPSAFPAAEKDDQKGKAAHSAAASPSSPIVDSDGPAPPETTRRGNTIPPPLLSAMKELQERRAQLEAQLAAAAHAAAQQQQRLQLLEEEAMVAHYALEASRKEVASSHSQMPS